MSKTLEERLETKHLVKLFEKNMPTTTSLLYHPLFAFVKFIVRNVEISVEGLENLENIEKGILCPFPHWGLDAFTLQMPIDKKISICGKPRLWDSCFVDPKHNFTKKLIDSSFSFFLRNVYQVPIATMGDVVRSDYWERTPYVLQGEFYRQLKEVVDGKTDNISQFAESHISIEGKEDFDDIPSFVEYHNQYYNRLGDLTRNCFKELIEADRLLGFYLLGTRALNLGEPSGWRTGIGQVSLFFNAPIIPVIQYGIENVCGKNPGFFKPGKVKVKIFTPIYLTSFQDIVQSSAYHKEGGWLCLNTETKNNSKVMEAAETLTYRTGYSLQDGLNLT